VEDRLYLSPHKHFFPNFGKKRAASRSETARVIKLFPDINYSFFFTFQNPHDVFIVRLCEASKNKAGFL